MISSLKLKIAGLEAGSLLTFVGLTAQYSPRLATAILIASGIAYLHPPKQLSRLFKKKADIQTSSQRSELEKQVQKVVNELCDKHKQNIKPKVGILSNNNQKDGSRASAYSLSIDAKDASPSTNQRFTIAHEFSHVMNNDSLRGCLMLTPLVYPATVIGLNGINSSLAPLALTYMAFQILAVMKHRRLIETRADRDGIDFSDNFEEVVKAYVSWNPSEHIKKETPIIKKITGSHPSGWARMEILEQYRYQREETPICDELHPKMVKYADELLQPANP